MWSVMRRNPLAVALALVLHLVLALLLLTDIFPHTPARSLPKAEVVQARVIDSKRLDQEVARLKQAEEKVQAQRQAAEQQEQKRLEELKRKQAEEKKRLAALEQERKAREKAEARRKVEAEKKKKAEAEKKKRAEAKRRAEAEKKKKEEAERKAAEEKKREEEAQKKAEAERKAAAEKRKEAERQAAEAARKKAEAEAQAAREAELASALAAEQDAREVDRYQAAIQQKLRQKWILPPNTRQFQCTVEVRLIPGGDVVSVRVVKSSGNASFDRSAEDAVLKAQPLPVPSGNLFEQFRVLTFEFDPRTMR